MLPRHTVATDMEEATGYENSMAYAKGYLLSYRTT